jgi:hypothetical protein
MKLVSIWFVFYDEAVSVVTGDIIWGQYICIINRGEAVFVPTVMFAVAKKFLQRRCVDSNKTVAVKK